MSFPLLPRIPFFVGALSYANDHVAGQINVKRDIQNPRSMEPATDEALLQRVAARDEEAFGVLYDRFSGPLYGLIKRILDDEQDARDIVQEGFLYLWNKAHDYDRTRSKAFTWAVVIFRNKAIDRLRALRRRGQLTEDASLAFQVTDRAGPERADQAADHAERAAMVRRVISELTEEQRRCIELAFFKGLSHQQLAEQLQTPLGTIKTHIRRGLSRMRDLMKGEV